LGPGRMPEAILRAWAKSLRETVTSIISDLPEQKAGPSLF